VGDLGHTDRYDLGSAVERARKRLAQDDPAEVARRSGAEPLTTESGLLLPFLTRPHRVSFPSLAIVDLESGKPPSPWLENLVLLHLDRADGEPLAHRWIAFQELPDGTFYFRAFQGYSGDALVREFGNEADSLRPACLALAAEPAELGNVGFRFPVFPRVPVGLAYWLGDDEFAPRARFLFDGSAGHYLPTDALAVVGGWLTGRIIRGKPRA